MTEHENIIQFIGRFKSLNPLVTEDLFLHGNCYWFAQILMQRFQGLSPELYYLPIEGHFITKICDTFYDVTGEVDPSQIMNRWEDFVKTEPTISRLIYRNCALFLDE